MNVEDISVPGDHTATHEAGPPPVQDGFTLPTAPNSSEGWSRRSGKIRVTRACDRCKKRKVRCNGQQPCNVCTEAAATCSFHASYSRGRRPNVRVSRLGPPAQIAADPRTRRETAHPASDFDSRMTVTTPTDLGTLEPSRPSVPRGGSITAGEPASRTSPEPTQTDLQGYYVGPSSGISFLSRIQKRFEETVSFPNGLSVFNFGDAPLPYGDTYSNSADTVQPYLDPTFFFLLNREDTARLVQRYFDFAVPVDRFLHRPTIERRLDEFYETQGTMHDKDAAPAETAVLFMVFAIAQEHMVAKLSPSGVNMSARYFRAANHQLSMEQGAVRLASVQARLCQCLWLLSQSRINHCWSLFGTVARLALALGLHRNRNARSDSMSQVEIECRRRTFWSAYSLDNYLSAALGRPRTFHDRDIDQELPSCVDDDDIDSMDKSIPSPTRGLSVTSGPIAYAKLTSSTRRRQVEQNERRAQIGESAMECLNAAMEIVGIVDALVQAKQLFRAFWFTPYFAFSACVILYVYTIQRSKEQENAYRPYFTAAERCQQQIVDIADERTLTSRYCLVLEELRAEAARQIARAQASHQGMQIHSSIDARTGDFDTLAPNAAEMAAAGSSMDVPDLAAMGPLGDLHVSPTDSLEDLTGWGQFDSMVSIHQTHSPKATVCNVTMNRWYLASIVYIRL
ncbi:putative transcriptional activator protein acu-15 [Macrophomina phaseolina]|uniref:Transcriptional activator protein acu-15 n=1 Tax=Macrophomina phaseolina TaxID=35725 RepID=A0ABQ8FQS0_9PEZI|nr:putative transcriptional activator protein acu-15 [Macrophomina phaseolina]